MYGTELRAGAGVGERDGNGHGTAQVRIVGFKFVHFDNARIGLKRRDLAAVRVRVFGRLAPPTRGSNTCTVPVIPSGTFHFGSRAPSSSVE
jgi:hypothetical protein